MRVSMQGLGRLGLPVACAMVLQGHEVYGYDIDSDKREQFKLGKCDYYEPDIDRILPDCLNSGLHIVDTVAEAVFPAEIIFIAVPTPSLSTGAFDTSYVVEAAEAVASCIRPDDGYKVIAIISTVLPTTVRQTILPVIMEVLGPPGNAYGIAYNAQFIAMGTVIENMLNPEFVLIGELDKRSGDVLEKFYQQLVQAPICRMSIESAEVTKLCYNTFLGVKITIANAMMELCDNIPHANCDMVTDAISLAKDRIISSRYMRGGLGDGGPCHPRDARALSYLAQSLHLSTDPFEYISVARLLQSQYLADLVEAEICLEGLPVAVLGLTFKPETNLTVDSPALLLVEQLETSGIDVRTYDPIIKPAPLPAEPHIYVLAMRHEQLKSFPFEPTSVIIDPWRMLDKPPKGCRVRSVGIGP